MVKKTTEYKCNGDCTYNDSKYVYDNGEVLKYDEENNTFEKIQVNLKSIDLSSYNIKLYYFEYEDEYLSFQEDLTTKSLTKLDNYDFIFNNGIIDNGYVVVGDYENQLFTKYNYKNNKKTTLIELGDSSNSEYFDYAYQTYENFVLISSALYANNLTHITDVALDDNYYTNNDFSIVDGYAYCIDGNHYNKYDKDGNKLSQTKNYQKVFNEGLSGKYAFVVYDNQYQIIDVTNDTVLVTYDVTYNENYGVDWLSTAEINDNIFTIALDTTEEHCGGEDAGLKFTYIFDTNEYGTSRVYLSETC